MAHFCQLSEDNIVLNVIAINDSDCLDKNGNESEAVGIAYCKSLYGQDTKWVQTSWNKRIRKHYGEPGFTYNEELDAFIPPKYYQSWIFNKETYDWDPPVPYPTDGPKCYWSESKLEWVPLNQE